MQLLLQAGEANADSPFVGFKLLDTGEHLDGWADVSETLGRKVGARNVLDKGAEVDTRVLLCVTICC